MPLQRGPRSVEFCPNQQKLSFAAPSVLPNSSKAMAPDEQR